MEKIKALGISHPLSGCHYHRVTVPLGFMDNIEGLVTNIPSEELINQGWDILLYNRGCSLNQAWDIIKGHIGIVMDIDDDWHLPANHLNYHNYELQRPILENNLRMADIVTTTNDRLAEKIYQFNQKVYVLPNALPYGEDQFTDNKEDDPDGKIRIFWAGGISHEHDLKLLKYPFKRLHTYKDKIKMILAGYTQDNINSAKIWERMYSSFSAGETLPGLRFEGLPPRLYMNLYKYADIMVIPLEQSEWHACKSNIKILEAACKGIPCIVSNVEPYSRDIDAPVLWVNKQSDWFDHLKYFINNKNAIYDYGQNLKAWAAKKYDLKAINSKRRELFEGVVRQIRGSKISSFHI